MSPPSSKTVWTLLALLLALRVSQALAAAPPPGGFSLQIGRASCREKV